MSSKWVQNLMKNTIFITFGHPQENVLVFNTFFFAKSDLHSGHIVKHRKHTKNTWSYKQRVEQHGRATDLGSGDALTRLEEV